MDLLNLLKNLTASLRRRRRSESDFEDTDSSGHTTDDYTDCPTTQLTTTQPKGDTSLSTTPLSSLYDEETTMSPKGEFLASSPYTNYRDGVESTTPLSTPASPTHSDHLLQVAIPVSLMVVVVSLFILVVYYTWKKFSKRRRKQDTNHVPGDFKATKDVKSNNHHDIEGQPGMKLNQYTPPDSGTKGTAASRKGVKYEEVDDITDTSRHSVGHNGGIGAPNDVHAPDAGLYEEAPDKGAFYYTLERGSSIDTLPNPSKGNGEYDKLDRGNEHGQNGASAAGPYDTRLNPSKQNGDYDKLERGEDKGQKRPSAGSYDTRLNPSKQNGDYDKLERAEDQEQKRPSSGQYGTGAAPSKTGGEYDKLERGRDNENKTNPGTQTGQYDKLGPKTHTTSYDVLDREGKPRSEGIRVGENEPKTVSKDDKKYEELGPRTHRDSYDVLNRDGEPGLNNSVPDGVPLNQENSYATIENRQPAASLYETPDLIPR